MVLAENYATVVNDSITKDVQIALTRCETPQEVSRNKTSDTTNFDIYVAVADVPITKAVHIVNIR